MPATNRSKKEQSFLATSLDDYFKGKEDSELPTPLKMDIVGSEREALPGYLDIINRANLKLAICTYHKPEDIYELPQTICGIQVDCRFVLRRHLDVCFDTVLYAVSRTGHGGLTDESL